MDDIGLFDLIEQIKQELLIVRPNDIPLFVIGDVELELSFTVTRTRDGQVDLKVVTAGIDRVNEQVQRIKVTLKPLMTAEEIKPELLPDVQQQIKRKLVRGEEREG